MYSHNKLLGLIKEHGMTQEMLAKKMGISSVTLSKKLKNKSDFTRKEVDAIRIILGIDDLVPYFFSH